MKKVFGLFVILMCFFAFGNVKEVHAVEINTSDIDSSTYIIGKYMFTRDMNDEYSGKLTTEFIMLAAKSIESNNLEDMIIYYKNARGAWVNAISNETIDSVDESVAVEYVNNEVFFSKPVLANITLMACGEGPGCDEFVPTLTDGAYGYDIGLINPNPAMSGYEIYEKDGNNYTKVGEGEIHSPEVILFEVEPGERKVFVARTFFVHENNVVEYSEYSNEVVIDHTKPETPVLRNVTLTACGAGPDCDEFKPTLNEGVYGYDLGINQNESISGYEIYEKDGNNYTKIGEGLLHEPEVIYVEVEPGESRTFVAKSYAINKSNQKIYSDYSNEVVIDHSTTPAPVLENVSINACGEGPECDEYIPTLSEGVYSYDLGIDHNPAITGYEIYEKVGDNYTKLDEGLLHSPEVILFEVEAGERRVFVAKAYATNKSGQKIYSAYSNEVVIDHTKPATPVLSNVTLTACGEGPDCDEYEYVPTLSEGVYGYDLGINQNESISGYEIYEKDGNSYTKIGEGEIHNPEVIYVEVEPGERRVFVAKSYALNKSNQKIYSDYSNEVVIDHTKPVTPVLANITLTACGTGPECQTFTPELVEGSYHYDLGITNQNESITGYEIYEKAGLNYIKIGDGLLHEPEVIEVTVNPGQTRTFVAKTYATNKSGQKIYSDQSNEVVIDHSTE